MFHGTMPSSLQGEYRAGGRVHTPSRVAPPVGCHQLPQGRSTHLLHGVVWRSVRAEEEARVTVTGLSGDTRYFAYAVASDVDGDNNHHNRAVALQPRPTRLTVRTADSRPPAWARPPTAAAVAVHTAEVTAALDEPGVVFFVVLPRGASPPSPLELLAGTGAEGVGAAACGAVRMPRAHVATTHAFNWTTTTKAAAAAAGGEEERRCREPLGAGLDSRVLHRLTQRANGVEALFSWGDVAAANALRPHASARTVSSPSQVRAAIRHPLPLHNGHGSLDAVPPQGERSSFC